MTSLRKRKVAISRLLLRQRARFAREVRLWDRMPAVGREFGGSDFERLMDEDRRNGVGVRSGVIVFLLQIDTVGAEKSSRDKYLQKTPHLLWRSPASPGVGSG